MSEYPPSGPSAAHGPSGYPAAPTGFPGAAAGSPAWPSPSRGPSRWPTFLALALAVVASGLAIVGWFRPSPPPAAPPSTTSDVHRATNFGIQRPVLRSSRHSTKGVHSRKQTEKQAATRHWGKPGGQCATLNNCGSWYLRDHLDPATPQPLADISVNISAVMLDIGANYLAGARDLDQPQASLLTEAQSHHLHRCRSYANDWSCNQRWGPVVLVMQAWNQARW